MSSLVRKASVLFIIVSLAAAVAAAAPAPKSAFITTSDGVRIHYLEAGKGPAIVFIPGWTMPAEIWERQIAYFSAKHHVVAVDPRSQGDSDKPAEGNYPERRARDYKELVDQLKLEKPVLVGWSMGVPELLSYVDQFGAANVGGVVLVDGFIKFPEAQLAAFLHYMHIMMEDRPKHAGMFVRGMYKKPQPEEYFERIARAAQKTPTPTAVELIISILNRLDWSEMMPKLSGTPVLFTRTKDLASQDESIRAKLPAARIESFDDAGHALFVDDAERFNKALEEFLEARK